MRKSTNKKINLSLYLKPADALRVLEWVYQNGMIPAGMYASKGQRIMAEFDLVKKTAEKDD